MTRQYTASPNYKVSARKNTLKDWDSSLRVLWLEFHDDDITQKEDWRYDR